MNFDEYGSISGDTFHGVDASVGCLHEDADPRRSPPLSDERDRFLTDERLDRLEAALSTLCGDTTTAHEAKARMSKRERTSAIARMRRVQRRALRGCKRGFCCVFSMRFDRHFKCPENGCVHVHKWCKVRRLDWQGCGAPLFPIGMCVCVCVCTYMCVCVGVRAVRVVRDDWGDQPPSDGRGNGKAQKHAVVVSLPLAVPDVGAPRNHPKRSAPKAPTSCDDPVEHSFRMRYTRTPTKWRLRYPCAPSFSGDRVGMVPSNADQTQKTQN